MGRTSRRPYPVTGAATGVQAPQKIKTKPTKQNPVNLLIRL